MEKLPFVLVLLVLISLSTSAQGLSHTSGNIKSFGTIEYSA